MGKRNIETSKEAQHPFSNIKAYSINEILAAGGADAFADKLGKNFDDIANSFKKLPKDAFLTDEEVEQALKILNESK